MSLRATIRQILQDGAGLAAAAPAPPGLAELAVSWPGATGLLRPPEAAVLSPEARVLRAETRVPAGQSCRGWRARATLGWVLGLLALLGLAGLAAPAPTLAGLTMLAVLVMLLSSGLKLAILAGMARHRRPHRPAMAVPVPLRPPTVSLLIPLLAECESLALLLRRLTALDYPHDLLDICLILEQEDATTQATLAGLDLPSWVQVVTVPRGAVQTKPRALNYALDVARGSIIGVYDAEDAPAPDQIRKVVAGFAAAPPDVVCLQGVLDYYNDRSNWLARSFAIEYASWFRVMLPGLARLGLVLPLGGTTLFFRRAALERLGGWDAHNVTEDADLGLRLARHGYRTQLIESVTLEEANARAWPWVRQRSRWLKGYAMTFGVHMRDPARLWRDLGGRRFLGVQLLFAGTLAEVLLAPVLWSFWLIPLGLPHPVAGLLAGPALWLGGLVFLAIGLLNIGFGWAGVRAAGKGWLWPWLPLMPVYHMLATVAAWKAVLEMVTRPYFWDKTAHGIFAPSEAGQDLPQLRLPVHSAASTARASSFRRVTKAFEIWSRRAL